MNDRRPNDEQLRVIEAPLSGPHLVDAGAGTGKTFTLVERAKRLVLHGDAAGERLAPHQLLVLTFTNKAAGEIADRLTRAFREHGIDELPTCSTFHAWGNSILREFAVESGISPDVRAVTNERARILFDAAFTDLLSDRLAVDVSALPILEHREGLMLSLAAIAFRLRDRGVSLGSFKADALAAADALSQQSWGQLWTPYKNQPLKRAEQKPKIERTREQRRAEAERERLNVIAVAALFARFDALLDAESLVTFGDLLARATALVRRSETIAAALRRRWRHALVDEFQDTNPTQMELLKAVFGEALVPVMAVGDIRQSIYGFNGADPEGMRRFALLAGCAGYPLLANRRSVQQILDAAHTFLAGQNDANVDPGPPLRGSKGDAAAFPLRVERFGTPGELDVGRQLEADAIAQEVVRLVNDGARPGNVAILLRSWRRARIYVEALQARGIPAKTHGGVGFFDAPEVRDALAWLRLIIDPADPRATIRVLQSPICGLSDGTLVAFSPGPDALGKAAWLDPLPPWLTDAEGDRIERTRVILRSLGHAATLPVSSAMTAIVTATGIDLAYAVVDPDGDAQTRANLAKLVRLATLFERDRPTARALDFVQELDERLKFDDDEREAELGGDEVAVMTAHAAKGLEWDYVFIANVSSGSFPLSTGSFTPAAQLDSRSSALALRYGADGTLPLRWLMRAPHDPATGQRLDKGDGGKNEETRLFYVAMTRAKSRLYVSGARSMRGDSLYLQAVEAWAQTRGENEASLAFSRPQPDDMPATLASPLGAPSDDRETCGRRPRALERERTALTATIAMPPRVLSHSAIATFQTCPRLARYRYLLRLPDLRDDAATPLWTAESSDPHADKLQPATFGTIVHRSLELIMRARIDGVTPDFRAFVGQAIEEEERDGDADLVQRAQSTVEHGVRLLADFTPRQTEARRRDRGRSSGWRLHRPPRRRPGRPLCRRGL